MGFDSNTGGDGGGTRGRGRMTYAERERRIKKNTQRKRDRGRERERDGGNTMISARRRKGATGRRETSVVRGFGLARSTRYPYSCYLRVLPTLSLLRFERVPPPSHGARAPFSPTPGLTAWRATIAIAKPPLSGRLVPLPYLGAPTARGDSGASQRASLRSRHGDVTLSSVVQ